MRLANGAPPTSPNSDQTRWQHWCGVCFQWRKEEAGRCLSCGTETMMTGERLPLQATSAFEEKRALLRHLRHKHPNLLSATLIWPDIERALEDDEPIGFANGCLPDSGLSDVPMALLVLIHRANHSGLYADHAEDDWLCREETSA